MATGLDDRVRAAALALMEELRATHGDVLPRKALVDGFFIDGFHIPLVVQWGIWKPKVADVPLTITTAPRFGENLRFDRDVFDAHGRMHYAYRGIDQSHYQNRGLREAMRMRVPLIYFLGVEKGRYRAFWPVYIVADNPVSLTFTVARTPAETESGGPSSSGAELRIHEP